MKTTAKIKTCWKIKNSDNKSMTLKLFLLSYDNSKAFGMLTFIVS